MGRVVVIGAGAAGLMAALAAARAGAPTLLLERTRDGGRKILISGGGRCNVLPAADDEARFVTDSSPHTLKKMLRSWPLREQRVFFESDLGIPLEEEAGSGKLFPASQQARDVRDGLLERCREGGVEIRTGVRVMGLRAAEGGWHVEHDAGPPLPAPAVVLATGGMSVPATGSDGAGLAMARALGHTIHDTYPALTPLTGPPGSLAGLAGVSLEAVVRARGAGREASSRGGFLFTHRGFSGPAVLDVSHVAVRALMDADEEACLEVAWAGLGEDGWREAIREPGASGPARGAVSAVLRRRLPARLAEALMTAAGVPAGRTLAELRREERHRLVAALSRCPLPVTGHEGYRKAEVTGGGVSLAELDPRTLESRQCPGLFLCGEILDAFGPIGGFNFQWAWATGRAAGRSAAAFLAHYGAPDR